MIWIVASAYAWEPTPTQAAMYEALRVRHPEPACADLAALSPVVAEDLAALVRNATMPPWVPMRAATCLVTDHAVAAEDEILSWLRDPNARGLAQLVARRVDALPEGIRHRVAAECLRSPHVDALRTELAASADPEVQALGRSPSEESR